MKIFNVQTDSTRIEVRRTILGRVMASFGRSARTLPWIALAGGVLFGIDYFGRLSAGQDVPGGLFWLAVAILALFFSLVLGISRFLRIDTWYFDRAERVVGFETRQVWGNPRGVTVGLKNLQRVAVHRAPPGARSFIELEFDDDTEILSETRLGDEQLDEIVEALKRELKQERVRFDD